MLGDTDPTGGNRRIQVERAGSLPHLYYIVLDDGRVNFFEYVVQFLDSLVRLCFELPEVKLVFKPFFERLISNGGILAAAPKVSYDHFEDIGIAVDKDRAIRQSFELMSARKHGL